MSIVALGCVLALAGALLHLAWRLMLAALVWAPSAWAGIVVGWYAVHWGVSIGLGVVITIVAARGVRSAIRRVFASRHSLVLMVEDDY